MIDCEHRAGEALRGRALDREESQSRAVPVGLQDESVTGVLFYPRRDPRGHLLPDGATSVRLPVEPAMSLSARLHAAPIGQALILLFHGNGEVASDYDDLAPLFAAANANLLAVDYRGYGASPGICTAANLLADAHAILKGLPLAAGGAADLDRPLILLGRSLGSAPAIELAATEGSRVAGLIIDSGFAETRPLLERLGRDPQPDDGSRIGEGFGNPRKMGTVTCPTLIIHGQRDTLVPVSDARALYDACSSVAKRLLIIPGARHNDLLLNGERDYVEAISALVRSALC